MTSYECFVVDHLHRTLSRKASTEFDQVRSYAHAQVERGLVALCYVDGNLDGVLVPDRIRLHAVKWA